MAYKERTSHWTRTKYGHQR